MNKAVVIAEELSVDRGERRVLENLSFSIERGEVFALLGGNGAGKSTALLTFLGFLRPAAGEAYINGLSVRDQIGEIRAQTAYLPESVSLYAHLSARENLRYFLSLAGTQRAVKEVEQGLDKVGLAVAARDERLSTYSKGMRQKVAIALAITRRTPVLLLDEPTSGLDPVAIDEFNSTLTELSKGGTTTFMVTHDVYGACHVAHRVGLLQNGRMVGLFAAGADKQISAEEVHRAFAEQHST